FGMIYDDWGTGPLYGDNLPRNSASTGQSYAPYYAIPWTGLVTTVVSIENNDFLYTSKLHPGQYKLRFWAPKHFGDYTNNDDFDIYHTPMFNLVY
ncbi:unnamed protein product, partial [Rotaria sp. Silwood1]